MQYLWSQIASKGEKQIVLFLYKHNSIKGLSKNSIKGFYRRHENAMYCEVHFNSHNYRDAVHYNYADFAERHNGSLNPLHGATMGA